MRYIGLYIFLIILMSSCKQTEVKPSEAVYEDIKTYFESEAKRLSQNKTLVNKTIEQNGTSEHRNQISVNWQDELSLYMASDINKPAWKDSYDVKKDSTQISYLAQDPNLKTQIIKIQKDNQGNIKKIHISNRTQNYLYESTEELIYIPDSIYSIRKKQNVILLGENSLFIKSLLNK